MDLSAALRRPRLIAAAACFLVGAIVLGVSLAPRLAAQAEPDLPATQDLLTLDAVAVGDLPPLAVASPEAALPAALVVYVTGAVPHPDVYLLPPGARVKDAVVAAGGLGPDAAAERLNLAETLSDAAHVHVPSLVEDAALTPPLPASPASTPASGPIDLNRATAADLEELPGIGKTIAERIVARRAEVGPYTAVEDLREVTGVGDKLYSQIAPLLTVTP